MGDRNVVVFEHMVVGPLGCNCYVVGDEATKRCIVIDPGDDADEIAARIAARGLTVTALVATHAHFDHVLGAERLRALTGAPFYMHPDDRPVLDWLQDSVRMFLGRDAGDPPSVDDDAIEGGKLVAGDVTLHVVHTPGHSPGSISLVAPGVVFSGDTLFAGSVGRTDLPGGDARTLVDSIRTKLFELDTETIVYPGHGESTTLGVEQVENPFVGTSARPWAG